MKYHSNILVYVGYYLVFSTSKKETGVLALSFFAAIFSSFLWLIYSLAYISDNTVGIKFSSLGIVDVSIYVGLVALPILILWIIFGYIIQYLSFRNIDRNLFSLFKQMKKNQDYTDLIARIMLESEQQIKDGFILNRIDILIADMNELIAEIINRASLASKDQIESLWSKVRNGGKWALGKVIIEISQNQPNFQMRIFEKSQKDLVLAGTVLEFCARYQNILTLLEKHDKERVFLTVIETGVFGKVYSILAPIADEVRRHRDVSSLHPKNEPEKPFSAPRSYEVPRVSEPSRYEKKIELPKLSIMASLSKLGIFNKKDKDTRRKEPSQKERDPFSMALERSFGPNDGIATPEIQVSENRNDEIKAPEIVIYHQEEVRNEVRIEAPVMEELVIKEPSFETSRFESPSFDAPQLDMPVVEDDDRQPRFEMNSFEEKREELIIRRDEDIFENTAPSIVLNHNDEPKFDVPEIKISEPIKPEPEIAQITSTQKTLNELKKEWEDMRKVSQPEQTNKAEDAKNTKEDYAYPFGGWTDESNYNK